MKSYFNITLLFCFCFSLSAQEKNEGKYTEEQLEVFGGTLQGHVKSVERIYYIGEEVSDGVDKKRFPNDEESNSKNEHCKYSFDKEGNITQYQTFDTLGNVNYKRIFTYNNLWLPSRIESFQYQDKKEVAHSLETYTYKGKEVALRETVMNTSFDKKKTNVFKDITKFNHKDQKESISGYAGNKLQTKITFTYDDKGNLTQEEYKNLTNKEENTTTYAYLSNGKVWQETSYELTQEKKIKRGMRPSLIILMMRMVTS